ncbi:hypothetical protein, partial [Frankia sp. CpI1-P]
MIREGLITRAGRDIP